MIDIRETFEKNRSEALELICKNGKKDNSEQFMLELKTPIRVCYNAVHECDITAVRCFSKDDALEVMCENTTDEDDGWGLESTLCYAENNEVYLEIERTCKQLIGLK
jgi:hypothetical protein